MKAYVATLIYPEPCVLCVCDAIERAFNGTDKSNLQIEFGCAANNRFMFVRNVIKDAL